MGLRVKGDGVAAAALDPKPRDLSDAEFVSGLSNEHLTKVISKGGPSVGLNGPYACMGRCASA